MQRVRIVTDSTADIASEELERFKISVVPLNVHWGEETFRDKENLSIDEFYAKLKNEKEIPRTSQPSAGQFERVYEELLRGADGVVSLHISSKLSGTMNSAQIAAKNVDPKRIAVIDSLTTTYALGSLATRTARLAMQGAGFEECVAAARETVPRLRLVAAVDTLEYLRRGGRIGRAQAFAGTLLSIKLIFQLSEGVVEPIDRVRTRAATIRRTAEVIRDFGPIEELAVLYGDESSAADQLVQLLRDYCPGLRIGVGRIGPVLGTHTGPGVFGAGFVLPR